MRQRVQKIIAAAGFCSRRRAEGLIAAGKVRGAGPGVTPGDQADVEIPGPGGSHAHGHLVPGVAVGARRTRHPRFGHG